MTSNEYLEKVISKYYVATGQGSTAWTMGGEVYPVVKSWAGAQLRNVFFSGSNAKGTAVKGTTDVDLFVSLKSDTSNTLKQIFDSLHSHLRANGYPSARKQNVSIHVSHKGTDIDLVPGVHYGDASEDHWLYVNKTNRERTQTNIDKHIEHVKKSGRLKEITLAKIWRKNHELDFPSFYLELAVIEALKYKRGDLSANFLSVLDYFSNGFESARFVDPANTNNIVSDTLTANEKQIITKQGTKSRQMPHWEQTVW